MNNARYILLPFKALIAKPFKFSAHVLLTGRTRSIASFFVIDKTQSI